MPRSISSLPLHRRFALTGSVVMLAGMALIGSWVASAIEESVTRNSAIATSIYMESFIAPLSQELASADALSPAALDRLRNLLSTPTVAERIVSVKIWKPGGLIAFSADPALIGQRFPPGESLKRAWQGELTATFDRLEDAEDAGERARGVALLEVYNPIHSIGTGEIIAVAEFYQNATELERDLFFARLKSWLLVAATTFATFGVLYGIVRNGSRTIARQHHELTGQLAEVARVSAQNQALRVRIQSASQRASETNERVLRRVSAELHDGPAQALALASLRLESLARRAATDANDTEAAELRATLDEAMRDIRNLCRGLALPEIEGQTIGAVLELAIQTHERRTGTTVTRTVERSSAVAHSAPHPTLICVYRFVQEGLMNAFRHADGIDQQVICRIADGRLEVVVADRGPGFAPACRDVRAPGLGLNGLRERVESIGGEFRIESDAQHGTRLSMTLGHGE